MGIKKLLLCFSLVGVLVSCDPARHQDVRKITILARSTTTSDSLLNYRMQLSYPEIDSASENWMQELNAHFVQEMEQDADSFRSFIQDFDPGMLRELEGDFHVHSNYAKLLSLSQRFVWAVPGTPILLGEVKTTNYRREKQAFLSLSECFKKEDFETDLLQKINAEVRNQYGQDICREVEKKDLHAFTLEKAGIRFFLDIYGGNPACQQLEIILPFEKLKGTLKSFVQDFFE